MAAIYSADSIDNNFKEPGERCRSFTPNGYVYNLLFFYCQTSKKVAFNTKLINFN